MFCKTHSILMMHSGPSSLSRVTRVSPTLLMLRPVPCIVTDVPPDIGPNAGSTPVTVGDTTVNSDGPITVSELFPRFMLTVISLEPGPLVNSVVSQMICVPGIYPSSCVMHGLELIMTLFTTSACVTPKSVPVMITVVPPSGGPEAGKTLVIVAAGHSDGAAANCTELWQSSETQHMLSGLPLHQPQSKPVPKLAPRHEEQPSASEGQLYRTTARNNTCIHNTDSMDTTNKDTYTHFRLVYESQ